MNKGTAALTECAAKYLLACTDPWNPRALGACVPSMPPLKSQKQRRYVRLTVTIGTAGTGFVTLDPNLSNNAQCVTYTTGSYASGVIPATLDTGVSTASVNSGGYALNQFGNAVGTVRGRIVSAAMSIQDISPVFDRGGMIYGLCQPEHESITAYTPALMAAYQESLVAVNDGARHSIVAFGISPEETAYPSIPGAGPHSDYTSPFSTSCTVAGYDSTVKQPIMGFMVTGKAGNTYQVEIVIHTEYIGQLTVPMQSRTDADLDGLGRVQEALANASGYMQAHGVSLLKSTVQSLNTIARHAPMVHDVLRFAGISPGGPSAPGYMRIMNNAYGG